ncbi:MAG: DUF2480 family protein [Sediminibacterium sp.]|nr:DUF2480 family protein [Sediminibacterium sp.]
MMNDEIVNKVANSGIVTIDPETFSVDGERVVFDLKPLLFHELILKEQDFRNFIKTNDWSLYKDKLVALTCSADAIVPTWAYMLIALALEPYARFVFFGTLDEMENALFTERVKALDLRSFKDARVVIKGCSNKPVPVNVYVLLSSLLKPLAKSIMYGEPCSTVPLFKAPKTGL